jgi:ATP-binding cassette, subfamily B, multidrug efflux pump
MALIFPVITLVFNASTIAVLWFGAARVSHGQVQIGALTAFMQYLVLILMSVTMATFMVMTVPRAAVCADRIAAVLDTQPSVVSPGNPVRALSAWGEVEFRHASFQYPGAMAAVVRDVSFRATPGQTTAVIGSTGAGKTTMVSLVARLFDITDGAVFVGGVDVRELDLHVLRSHIGMVPQRPYLFSGTVASNLRYGNPDASDEDLWRFLEIAQAREFVEQMPGQLAAPVTQGGTNLSGGQRQRLAIARALVRQPAIYLFDDSFSALDLGTDARLRTALRPVTEHATVIIVAQRVSTIIDADQIVVVENGEVIGIGRHGELVATCPTYAEIVESQLAVGAAA